MPWLSRQNSTDSVKSDDSFRDESSKLIVDSAISFIPAQIDGLCGTSSPQHKQTAAQIVMADLRLVVQNIRYLANMARTLRTRNVWQKYRSSFKHSREAMLQLCLATTQFWILCAAIPSAILLPGGLFALFVMLACSVNAALSWGLNGERVVMIKREQAPMTEDLSDERWFYVNGAMTSNASLKEQCMRLSRTFARPVTGVHNCTDGPIVDFLLTLLLRSTSHPTACTRILISQLRDACLNNSISKVIVLSHGTGALHVSLALDSLHADLPADVLCKLEIYTFGSAASHINNPLNRLETIKSAFSPSETTQATFTRSDGSIKSPVKATLASLGHRVEDHERIIPHIEHYALSNDVSARWGVLHSVRNVLDGRFCGRVFVMQPSTETPDAGDGFLMQEHYLDRLFPTNGKSDLLDVVVAVDRETAEKREFTAMGVALPMKSIVPPSHRGSIDGMMMGAASTSGRVSPEMSPRSKAGLRSAGMGMGMGRSEKRASWGTAGAMGIDGVGKARMGAKECEGRTVRQLSRLWRYIGGARPVGEGVAVMNGIGNHGMVQ